MRNGKFGRLMAIAAIGFATMGGASIANAGPTTLIYINDANGKLYSYDSAAGYAETVVAASTTLSNWGGARSISSGPLGNTLYFQHGNGKFSTYDLGTHAQTSVGGFVPGNALGEGRDGYLYAGAEKQLSRVDPGTGVSTLIGSGIYDFAGDITVDPTSLGTMFGAVTTSAGVSLVSIDRSTGAQSLIGSFGLGVGDEVWGLGFSLDGTLFAAGPTGSTGGIFTINKTTGAATSVKSLSYQPYDMATQPFEENEPNPMPEPASLVLVGVALAGMGLARRRRID